MQITSTNDLRERTKRIASQFSTADLLRVAAYLVEQAGNELDGAVDMHGDPLDLSVEITDVFNTLERLAEQASEAREPTDPTEWDMSPGAATLGVVTRRVAA